MTVVVVVMVAGDGGSRIDTSDSSGSGGGCDGDVRGVGIAMVTYIVDNS